MAAVTSPNHATASAQSSAWPLLPFESWQDTLATLHMWTQIVGKTRLALAPMQNHWWQVPLYVTARGLTTSAMPFGDRTVEVAFDFQDHNLAILTSDGAVRSFALAPRTVGEFYGEYVDTLRELGVDARIRPVPVEVEVAVPFAEDLQHAAYDADAVHRWWRAMVQVDRVLKRFRSRFVGKASPVHFFWGSFDLAATRFSGRRAPAHPGGAPNCPDYVMREAHSHECSSVGFWPGGPGMPEAAFYSYAYPEPSGYSEQPVAPAAAGYNADMREFILSYDAVRSAASPEDVLLDFFQATYEAEARLANWDPALERPDCA